MLKNILFAKIFKSYSIFKMAKFFFDIKIDVFQNQSLNFLKKSV
jgi:hypothetical protein